MLYTVEDLSIKFNVSKVTIYSKLKHDNIKPYVLKEEGKTKVKEEALNLIKEALKLKDDTEDNSSTEDGSAATILNLSESLITSLNSQIDFLQSQIVEKDKQLERSDEIMKNMQVLFKNEQENLAREQKQIEHFKYVDSHLINAVRNKEVKPEPTKQNIFKRIFKR